METERGTYAQRVHRYLQGLTPKPVCDDCIGSGTDISRENVNQITQALGLTTDFDKGQGTCSGCHGRKLVTRSLRYA
jgi:biotin operon repressor